MMPIRNARRFFYKALNQPAYAFKVFIKRLKAYFYYWRGKGNSSYPEAITIFLTHRCNLRCKMCGQWGEGGVTKQQPSEDIKEELSLENLKRIVDDLSIFRPNITLFGGEPLLHPACIDIIKYIKSKNMHCLVVSNGSLLNNLAEELVKSGLDELNISLDAKSALHDEIRGLPGLFEWVMEGVKKVNYFKKESGRKKPLINLQCTITKYNYLHLEQMLEVAGEAMANALTFHNLIFIDKELIEKQKEYDQLLGCSSYDWQGFIFEPGIEVEQLYAKMEEIKKRSYNFQVDFYPNFSLKGLRQYYKTPSYQPSEYSARCPSPWITAYIFTDGEMRPCLNFNYSYGNILTSRFGQLWNNEKAVKFRRLLKQNQIFPVCVRCTELYRY